MTRRVERARVRGQARRGVERGAGRKSAPSVDALTVLRVVEGLFQHGLKHTVLEGVDGSAALAEMERSPSVANLGKSLLGQRTLAWTQYLLHRADPARFVAPSFTLVKLAVTTAYSVADSPIPTIPDDQHTLAFRILAQLSDASAPITGLTGASVASLVTGKDLRLDPAAFFESFDATKPKASKPERDGQEAQSATFSLVVLPAIARDLVEGARWETTAWAGR